MVRIMQIPAARGPTIMANSGLAAMNNDRPVDGDELLPLFSASDELSRRQLPNALGTARRLGARANNADHRTATGHWRNCVNSRSVKLDAVARSVISLELTGEKKVSPRG